MWLRCAALAVVLACLIVGISGGLPGPWSDGRSTYYTGWDQGHCSLGTIDRNDFPTTYIAAPDAAWYATGMACGRCYEVSCVGPWTGSQQCCKGPNVTVLISYAPFWLSRP